MAPRMKTNAVPVQTIEQPPEHPGRIDDAPASPPSLNATPQRPTGGVERDNRRSSNGRTPPKNGGKSTSSKGSPSKIVGRKSLKKVASGHSSGDLRYRKSSKKKALRKRVTTKCSFFGKW